ncbi:hypothetical protein J4218_01465 [Candidatus Pacearchaeota archaeon]|nr:hypothetical protein [Candidatus Pacearchaeota archaeon]
MNKQIIIFLICLNIIILISLVNAGFYYDVKISYNDSSIAIKDIEIVFSHYDLTTINYSEAYVAKLGEKEFYFNVPIEQYSDIVDNKTGEIISGGKIEKNNFDFEIFIPYSPYAKDIILYDNLGNELTSDSLIEFTNTYSKQEYENLNLIKEDIDTSVYNNTFIDEIVYEENTLVNNKFSDYSLILVIILLGILIALIAYYLTSGNKKKRR